MTERERLIVLIERCSCHYSPPCTGECGECHNIEMFDRQMEHLADHLLRNGVIVPPCKVGDRYYTIQRYCNTDPWETEKEPVMAWDCEKYCGRSDCSFSEYRIEEHQFKTVNFILRAEQDFGKTVFLTKEEAEKALAEREQK